MINKFISGLSANEKRILLIASLFLLVALFDRLMLAPSLGRLKELDQIIVKEENSIAQNLRVLAHRDRIMKESDAFKDFYASEVRAEEEVIAEFLKKVEALASKAEVELSKVAPAGQESERDYIKYLVTLDCAGTFEAITNFIFLVNNSKELLRVEKMSIAAGQRDTDRVQSSLSISKMIIGADSSKDAKSLVRAQSASTSNK